MHVAVGKQADEVDDTPAGLGAGNDLLPRVTLPDGAVGNRIGDQRRALAIDLAGAERVVADLGVAHVVVGGHADRGAVCAQADVRVAGEEAFEGRFPGGGDGAADVGFRQAVAVDDDDDDRTLDAGEGGKLLQHERFLIGNGKGGRDAGKVSGSGCAGDVQYPSRRHRRQSRSTSVQAYRPER